MKTRVAAIEFGTSKIVTVIAQSSSRDKHVEIISCGKVEYDGYSSGDWNSWENLAPCVYNSIIAAQSDAGIPIKEIYIGVPCEFIHVETAEAEVPIKSRDGRVSVDDMNAAEDMAAEMLHFKDRADYVIHRSPCYFSVDHGEKKLDVFGIRGDFLSVKESFVTASIDFIEDMRAIMEHAGITINGFLSPSLGEQLLTTQGSSRDKGCVFVDCGLYNTEVSAMIGDGMLYHAVLPMGGNDITEFLAQNLNIDYDEAELLKRSAVISKDRNEMVRPPVCHDQNGRRIQYKPEIICSMVSSSMVKLCDLIKRTITEAISSGLSPQYRGVYVTGGGIANLRGGAEYLSDYLGRKVVTAAVSTNKLGSPEYTSVLGLVDLIFDSIEQRFEEQGTLPMRVADTFKGLFARSRNDNEE